MASDTRGPRYLQGICRDALVQGRDTLLLHYLAERVKSVSVVSENEKRNLGATTKLVGRDIEAKEL